MMKSINNNNQSGAVSLFIVIFAMLLITVVTVSFLRLMMNDQQQASNNDLSQSAYDSAQAGVEDAKRALLRYQQQCSNDPAGCPTYANQVANDQCNAGLRSVTGAAGNEEVMVQQSLNGSDAALQQAYTCVKIQLETSDYIGDLEAGESQLVPLFSNDPFDRVGIEWFSKEDLSSSNTTNAVSLNGVASNGQPLYSQGNWPVNRPPLMRAQLIQFADSSTVTDFDTVSGSQSNSATAFLYPTRQANIGERILTAVDQRKTDPADNPNPKDSIYTPLPISCKESLTAGGYACSTVLVLPDAVGSTGALDRTAFLRLVPLYNSAHFRVTLWQGPVDLNNPTFAPQKFKDVQPEVDSTGRANDLFRRVVSRVDLYDTSFPYPEATIDVTGNFCKDFAVTDTTYIPGSSGCTP